MSTPQPTPDIATEELDRRFDDGEDLTPYFDYGKAVRLGSKAQPVNADNDNPRSEQPFLGIRPDSP
jgi:hypothetical protein